PSSRTSAPARLAHSHQPPNRGMGKRPRRRDEEFESPRRLISDPMRADRRHFVLVIAALTAGALMLAAPAQSALTAPAPLDPGNGASFQATPPFAWSAVPGA